MMVRDEPLAVSALRAVLPFCDEMVVVDTGSRAELYRELVDFKRENDQKIKIHTLELPDATGWKYSELPVDFQFPCSEIHNLMIGTSKAKLIWIVDGDEVYSKDAAADIRKVANEWPETVVAAQVPLVWMASMEDQVEECDPQVSGFTFRLFRREGFEVKGSFPHEQGWNGQPIHDKRDDIVTLKHCFPFLHFEPMLKPWRRTVLQTKKFRGRFPEVLEGMKIAQ